MGYGVATSKQSYMNLSDAERETLRQRLVHGYWLRRALLLGGSCRSWGASHSTGGLAGRCPQAAYAPPEPLERLVSHP